ncbi:MAG: hypothetical protein ACU0CI_02470 [Shimia sp.]
MKTLRSLQRAMSAKPSRIVRPSIENLRLRQGELADRQERLRWFTRVGRW